jgi:hypothetical protein
MPGQAGNGVPLADAVERYRRLPSINGNAYDWYRRSAARVLQRLFRAGPEGAQPGRVPYVPGLGRLRTGLHLCPASTALAARLRWTCRTRSSPGTPGLSAAWTRSLTSSARRTSHLLLRDHDRRPETVTRPTPRAVLRPSRHARSRLPRRGLPKQCELTAPMPKTQAIRPRALRSACIAPEPSLGALQ